MANIELVIKIPEEYYYAIKSIHNRQWDTDMMMIQNGVPLPKGHGKLVDLDQMCDDYWDGNHMEIYSEDLDNIKTIIEADTQNKEKEDIMPYITGATLLSASEARSLNKEILKADKDWWLGSRGNYVDFAACVNGDYGFVYANGRIVGISFGVRPALEISDLESSGYKIGESFYFGDHSFTIISDTYALCDDMIGKCAFRKDSEAENANEYEASDIKRYVETWFEKVKEQSREEPEEERNI